MLSLPKHERERRHVTAVFMLNVVVILRKGIFLIMRSEHMAMTDEIQLHGDSKARALYQHFIHVRLTKVLGMVSLMASVRRMGFKCLKF